MRSPRSQPSHTRSWSSMFCPCSEKPDRFAQSLAEFLVSVPEPVIVADWPDDIRCLCDGLGQFGSGMRFRLGCTLVLLPQKPLGALQTTHNALLDARALRLWHAEQASATACDELCPAGL
jgi:hypothetical protein